MGLVINRLLQKYELQSDKEINNFLKIIRASRYTPKYKFKRKYLAARKQRKKLFWKILGASND